jgi:hypothetical protein
LLSVVQSGFTATMDFEFAEDAMNVVFDRLNLNKEPLGDFLIAESLID